jgi:hypothetical protein
MNADFASATPILRIPQQTEPIEGLTDDDVRLLHQDSHRQAPDESARPSIVFLLETMPSPSRKDAKRLAHASGDSHQSASRNRLRRQ